MCLLTCPSDFSILQRILVFCYQTFNIELSTFYYKSTYLSGVYCLVRNVSTAFFSVHYYVILIFLDCSCIHDPSIQFSLFWHWQIILRKTHPFVTEMQQFLNKCIFCMHDLTNGRATTKHYIPQFRFHRKLKKLFLYATSSSTLFSW